MKRWLTFILIALAVAVAHDARANGDCGGNASGDLTWFNAGNNYNDFVSNWPQDLGQAAPGWFDMLESQQLINAGLYINSMGVSDQVPLILGLRYDDGETLTVTSSYSPVYGLEPPPFQPSQSVAFTIAEQSGEPYSVYAVQGSGKPGAVMNCFNGELLYNTPGETNEWTGTLDPGNVTPTGSVYDYTPWLCGAGCTQSRTISAQCRGQNCGGSTTNPDIASSQPASCLQFTFAHGSTAACVCTQYGLAGMHFNSYQGTDEGVTFFDNQEQFISFSYSQGAGTNNGTGLDWGQAGRNTPGGLAYENPFILYAGDCASTLKGFHVTQFNQGGALLYGSLNANSAQGCMSSTPCYPCASGAGLSPQKGGFFEYTIPSSLSNTTPINGIDALFGWYRPAISSRRASADTRYKACGKLFTWACPKRPADQQPAATRALPPAPEVYTFHPKDRVLDQENWVLGGPSYPTDRPREPQDGGSA